jgi:hypothetical protein
MFSRIKKFVATNKETIALTTGVASVIAVAHAAAHYEARRVNNAIINTRKSMISEVTDHFDTKN